MVHTLAIHEHRNTPSKEPTNMKRDTKFKPGVSGNETAKWGPGQGHRRRAHRTALSFSVWHIDHRFGSSTVESRTLRQPSEAYPLSFVCRAGRRSWARDWR